MHINSPLQNIAHWQWNGQHYEKTANAWLANMDAHKDELWPILRQTYGADHVAIWWVRWRIFFMACAELFGYDRGNEWLVGHYLFDTSVGSDKPSANSQ
jgi:cyclopropane-fatty-acyl-phospholipid synthase